MFGKDIDRKQWRNDWNNLYNCYDESLIIVIIVKAFKKAFMFGVLDKRYVKLT